MRPRSDFYTLCPGCEQRLDLTLSVRLQAARMGTSCRCAGCATEWICIQEWVFRDMPLQPAPIPEVPRQHNAHPTTAQWSLGQNAVPAAPQQMPPARPHLPTFQPPRYNEPVFTAPTAPTAQPAPVTQPAPAFQANGISGRPAQTTGLGAQANAGQLPGADQPVSHSIPKPHAWSWERVPTSQSADNTKNQTGDSQ